MSKRVEILFSSYRRYLAGDRLIPHNHNAHTLHYIADGEGTFLVEQRQYRVKAGDCFLVFAGQSHELLPVKQKITVITVRLRFIGSFFAESFDPVEIPFQNRPSLGPYLNYIYRNRSSSDPEHIRNTEDILSAILLGFKLDTLTYAQDRPIMVSTDHYTKPTKMILVYIEGRINKKISLDDMAAKLFYNKSYLCEIFKAETGISISEYINLMRIRQAFDYFVFNNYTTNDILMATGFSSISYFCKVFKKVAGITPGEFQKLLSQVTEEERKRYFTETGLLKFQLSTLDTLLQNLDTFKQGLSELKKRYL